MALLVDHGVAVPIALRRALFHPFLDSGRLVQSGEGVGECEILELAKPERYREEPVQQLFEALAVPSIAQGIIIVVLVHPLLPFTSFSL